MRLAVEATGIGLWSLDVASGALEWSPRMQEIMGRTEPLRDEEYLLAVHPDDQELARAVYDRLRGGDDTPEAAALLDDAVIATNRAARVVRQLMTFAGRTHATQSKIVPLTPLIRATVELSRRSMPAEIQLDLEAPEADVHVQCDPDELSEVLLNLLLNARDALSSAHSDNAHVHIEIVPASPTAARPAFAAGVDARARVSVRDNGPGMADHVRRRVFDPFFTTKGPTAGTGLGLAISWSVVRALGGTIECESVPNQGSAFHLYLPVTGADVAESAPRRSVPPFLRPLSILLVDDDHFVRRVTRRALLRARHSVTEATSAKEALDIAGQDTYDIVLLDQWLPDSCGTDIIDEMRLRTAGAKIVLFTGQEVDESTTRAADALLSKPMGARELLDTLANLMAAPSQGIRSGVPSAPPLRT